MVKRESGSLSPPDRLHCRMVTGCFISDDEEALKETYKNIGISEFSYRKND